MDYLIDRFGIANRYLGKTVMEVTSYFASEVQLEEVAVTFLSSSLPLILHVL